MAERKPAAEARVPCMAGFHMGRAFRLKSGSVFVCVFGGGLADAASAIGTTPLYKSIALPAMPAAPAQR